MLKEFHPQQKPGMRAGTSDIMDLCRKGQLAEALKAIEHSKAGREAFAEEIALGVHKMVVSRRINEVLSLMYKYDLHSAHSVQECLRMMIVQGDIPGFLKQAHRFHVCKGFEKEISDAIQWLDERKQFASAEAYRRKFRTLGWES
jgi:hypothetical protein